MSRFEPGFRYSPDAASCRGTTSDGVTAMTLPTGSNARPLGARARATKRALRRLAVGTFLLTSLTAACAPRAAVERGGTTTARDRLKLIVENDTFEDLTIYVASPGWRRRIGRVLAASSAVVWIPTAAIGSGLNTQLLARPLASSRTIVSDPFTFVPGETYLWKVGLSRANTYLIQR